jgi:predicted nucleic acid-binding protein
MRLVVDASMALAWLFERANAREAACAERGLLALAEAESWVPPLWHTEILNALLKGERCRVVSEATVLDYLNKLSRLPLATDDIAPSSRRDSVLALAREHHLTAYDATYLELALRRDAQLATFDGALAQAMRQTGGLVFGDT